MALLFDASTELVGFGSPASLDDLPTAGAGTFSVAAWVYPLANAANSVIVSKGVFDASGWAMMIDNFPANGNLRAYCLQDSAGNFDDAQLRSGLALNTWHFIGFSYENGRAGDDIRLFHGTATSVVTEPTPGASTDGAGTYDSDVSDNLVIGVQNGNWFNGRIDRVGIYSTAFTLDDFKELQWASLGQWNRSDCLFLTGLENTGTVADHSGNGITGSVTGATVTVGAPLPPWFGFNTVGYPAAAAASGDISSDGVATADQTGAAQATGVILSEGAAANDQTGAVLATGVISADGIATADMGGVAAIAGAMSADGIATADLISFVETTTEEPTVTVPDGSGGAWGRASSKRKKQIKREDEELMMVIKHLAPQIMRHRRTLH